MECFSLVNTSCKPIKIYNDSYFSSGFLSDQCIKTGTCITSPHLYAMFGSL